jgi:hypothetical protein
VKVFCVVRELPVREQRELGVKATANTSDRFAFAVSGERSIGMLSASPVESVWTIKSISCSKGVRVGSPGWPWTRATGARESVGP